MRDEWVKLPSGRLLNLANIAAIDPYRDSATIRYCTGVASASDGTIDSWLVADTVVGDDARALVALVERHATSLAAQEVAK